ncbi:GtrA family protein [Pseudomonas pseudonitroreducens]|uniref:GtrA family protein n=1 Tax=Pseudomonas pseudonitroreducens TaxID=2892326 RepID=UPI001F2A90E9|nr:GtrA family protein [Pseudomonas pseudonitroreducens]
MIEAFKLLQDRRYYKFIMVGGLCFGINLATLYILTGVLGVHYLASMLASIVIANTTGWALNRRWTFSPSGLPATKEFLKYFSANMLLFLASMALMALLVSGLGINYLVASAVIAIGMTAVNFIIHRDWSFKKV